MTNEEIRKAIQKAISEFDRSDLSAKGIRNYVTTRLEQLLSDLDAETQEQPLPEIPRRWDGHENRIGILEKWREACRDEVAKIMQRLGDVEQRVLPAYFPTDPEDDEVPEDLPEHAEIEKPPIELRISTWVALNAWASAVDSRLKSLGEKYLDLRVGRMYSADEVAAELQGREPVGNEQVRRIEKQITVIQVDALRSCTLDLEKRMKVVERRCRRLLEYFDPPKLGTVKLDST